MKMTSLVCHGLALSITLGSVALIGTGCAGSRYERSTGAYIDDKATGARVKTALFRDPLVSGFDVGVNTFRGEVQLSGFVETEQQKQRAEQIARSVEGVQNVINDLEIKPAPAVGGPGSSVEGSSGDTSGTRPPLDIDSTPSQSAPNDTTRPLNREGGFNNDEENLRLR
jgi:hypothetical protein